MICKWCGDDSSVTDWWPCDCKERMECDKVGQVGHMMCGIHPCGCPRFTHLNPNDCPNAKTFKWQKAKIFENGELIWVENKKPESITVGHAEGPDSTMLRFFTNHLDCWGQQMTVVPERIELIGEFSNDVEMVKWGIPPKGLNE